MNKENLYSFLVENHLIEISTIVFFVLINRAINLYYFKNLKASKKLVFVGFIAALLTHFVFFQVNLEVKKSKMEMMTQMLPDIRIILTKLNHNLISTQTNNDDPVYLKLVETEKEILKENSQISDVYTLTRNQNNQYSFLVDSETDYDRNGEFNGDREVRTPIGEKYENQKELLDRAWQGKVVYTENPYKDKWGSWVSVFSPIQNESGQTQAILGIDFSAVMLNQELVVEQTKIFILILSFIAFLNVVWSSRECVRREKETAIQNLNEKSELIKQVQLQQEMLAESSRLASLGQMAGGIAHEINNPLAIIQVKASQVRRMLENDKNNKLITIPYLKDIEKTSQRISQIIGGLKTFARDGSQDPFVPWSVSQIISETVSLCAEKFKEKNVQLTISPLNEIEINCLPVQLSQVLLNLLNNAFYAVQSLDEKWVRIDVTLENETLNISVTDSGSGIPHDIAEKLMNPFFTTKPVGQGTGLGLSISTGIIKNHNGVLKLDRHCKNTRFVIQLPFRQPAESKAA